MSQEHEPTTPQFRADRPDELEAVRTTIVGGRPPGSGKKLGDIPRGIEVLIKKAAVDADFKTLLLDQREAAADAIGLPLDPAEVLMLKAAPAVQLETVIAQTDVPNEHRRAFLGQAAAAMLAAIGVSAYGCDSGVSTGDRPDRPGKHEVTDGIRPKRPAKPQGETGSRPERPDPKEPIDPVDQSVGGEEAGGGIVVEPPTPTKGIRPDTPPEPISRGVRPDRPPEMLSRGSRPDPPPPKSEN
jgi:hypothetical protein